MTPDLSQREERFLNLLMQHKHQLFTLIFCIVRNLSDSEDVFQKTAMALWTHFDRFRPGAEFLPWASQVARNQALSLIRSKRREYRFFSESLVGELHQLLESRFGPPDVQEVRMEALAKCREKLSETDKKLVALCYSRRTIHEAAEQVGRPVRAVYGSLSRIRRFLYECVERALAREEHA